MIPDAVISALVEATVPADVPAEGHAADGQSDALRAITAYLAAGPTDTDPQLDRLLERALSSPPVDGCSSLALLMVGLRWSLRKNRQDDAIWYARRIAEIDDPSIPKPLRLAAAVDEMGIWRVADRADPFDQAYARASALDPQPGGPLWLKLQSSYFLEMINRRQGRSARGALQQLQAHGDGLRQLDLPSPEVLNVYYCFSFGLIDEGLACYEQPELKQSLGTWSIQAQLRATLLVFAGRLAEATSYLQGFAFDLNEKERPEFEVIEGYICLARRDFEGARNRARSAVALAEDLGATCSNGLLLVANAELVQRRAVAARSVLQRLDASEDRPYFDMQWARLLVLENRIPDAARHFRRILDQDMSEYVQDRLRFAFELSAYDLARIWTLATRQSIAPTSPLEPLAVGARQPAARANSPARPQVETPVWVGTSAASRQIRATLREYAPHQTTVLISGETGTGKEVAARLLHSGGPRADRPFLPVNCGSLSETLMESELFGHVKGAFTGAGGDHQGLFMAAGEGTVFLDEIHAMSPRLQAALLRVLENGEVRPVGATRLGKMRARVLAATNISLSQAVSQGAFREDLYYRLSALHVHLPPLRERPEDIVALAHHFLRSYYGEFDVALDEGFLVALRQRRWTGNARELRYAIERAALRAGETNVLTAEHFRRAVQDSASERSPTDGFVATSGVDRRPPPGNPRSRRLRRERLRGEFRRYRELSRSQAAQLLGCAPDTAARDLKALQAEGFIRRVNPSSHPRTSYFEIVGNSHDDR